MLRAVEQVQEVKAQLVAEGKKHADAEAALKVEVAQLRAGSTVAPVQASIALNNTGSAQSSAVFEVSPQRFTEEEEDRELINLLFKDIDADKDGTISFAELTAALGKHGMQAGLTEILACLVPVSGAKQDSISHTAFRKAFEKLPRVRGELVSWSRSLRLEEHLARLISKSRRGNLLDGLKGLKDLKDVELVQFVQSVSNQFATVLCGVLLAGLHELRSLGVASAKSHVNTKFALDGAYVGQFATLDDFYRGPEALIGTPNPKVLEGLEAEHCRRLNAGTSFTTPNYNVTTTPKEEWEFVVCPRIGHPYAHTPKDKRSWPPGCVWKGDEGREVELLEKFMAMEEVTRAGLKREEVIGLRLYTGPTFVLYNARLRGFPAKEVALLEGNDYETTIFIIASGITKLAKVTGMPPGRLLFRGLGGMILPRQFWEEFHECRVTLTIHTSAGATLSSEAIRQQLGQLCEVSATATAFDVGSSYLRLNLQGEAAKLAAAGNSGRIRVVKPPSTPSDGQGIVRMVLALPLSQSDLTHVMLEALEVAVVAACGGAVSVRVEVHANKPFDFKGGGAPPSTTPTTTWPHHTFASSLVRPSGNKKILAQKQYIHDKPLLRIVMSTCSVPFTLLTL
jgi:hypothetical protein